MQDRISNHPNRWVLTPVTGETDTYDFTRADDPTQVGTPLNKATFLPDATVSTLETLTGISGITLPADALDAIASYLTSLDNSTIGRVVTGRYTGTGTSGSSNPNTLTFNFKPRLVILNDGDPNYSNWYGNNRALYIYNRGGTYTISDYTLHLNVTDNTLSWYYASSSGTASTKAQFQHNTSGRYYYYIAIGVV